MTPHFSDEIAWAAKVGARLQMLQASFADDDAAARTGYVEEEIERALRDVLPGQRTAHLEALAERFPAWEKRRATTAEITTLPVEETPDALVAKLTEVAASLSDEDRWSLSYRLQQAGYAVSVPEEGAQDEVPIELQRKLGMSPGQKLDRKRALRLVAMLTDLVVTMDQLSWNVWRSLAPNSIVRRDPGATGDVKKLAGPFLVGDVEVSATQISQLLDKTRQLIAGLLAAIGSTGESFARQHLARFSPQAIKELAEADPGFFIGAEQKCWRKYIEVFNQLSGVGIEKEIANTIVKYTEELILGAGRPAAKAAE